MGKPNGPEQWKAAMVIDPMPVPGSPLPWLSLPDMLAGEQPRVVPVVVSVSAALLAVAVMVPPGRTVQVVAA